MWLPTWVPTSGFTIDTLFTVDTGHHGEPVADQPATTTTTNQRECNGSGFRHWTTHVALAPPRSGLGTAWTCAPPPFLCIHTRASGATAINQRDTDGDGYQGQVRRFKKIPVHVLLLRLLRRGSLRTPAAHASSRRKAT